MRFTVTGEWTKNHLLALIVWFFLLFALLLWLTNGALYFQAMTLDPASVTAYYLGDEATFRSPRSLRMLLEVSHFHLFAMAVMITTLTHLLLFVPIPPKWKARLVVLTFTGALADELSGWGVRFLHPAFAWSKVAGFLALQVGYLACVVLVGWALWTHAKSAYRDSERAAA